MAPVVPFSIPAAGGRRMNRMGLRGLIAGVGLVALVSIPFQVKVAGAADAAGGSGDLWEVTSQMSMEGAPMALPSQTSKVCAPKEWKEPPGGADERRKCQVSDFTLAGPKATWKVRCAGPPEMAGEGELVRSGDAAYSGSMKFTSAQGNMTIKLDGKKIGPCELGKK
jgi:uncharacterized protein DUF3617